MPAGRHAPKFSLFAEDLVGEPRQGVSCFKLAPHMLRTRHIPPDRCLEGVGTLRAATSSTVL